MKKSSVMPCYGVERTRKQVQCRGPNGCKAFSFSKEGGEAKAVAKAQQWVMRECKRLGAQVPKNCR